MSGCATSLLSLLSQLASAPDAAGGERGPADVAPAAAVYFGAAAAITALCIAAFSMLTRLRYSQAKLAPYLASAHHMPHACLAPPCCAAPNLSNTHCDPWPGRVCVLAGVMGHGNAAEQAPPSTSSPTTTIATTTPFFCSRLLLLRPLPPLICCVSYDCALCVQAALPLLRLPPTGTCWSGCCLRVVVLGQRHCHQARTQMRCHHGPPPARAPPHWWAAAAQTTTTALVPQRSRAQLGQA